MMPPVPLRPASVLAAFAALAAVTLAPAAASAAPATDPPIETEVCGIAATETITYNTPFHEGSGAVTGFERTTYSTASGSVTVLHAGRSQVLSESETGATLLVTGLLAQDTSDGGASAVIAGRAVETVSFGGSGGFTDTLTITRGGTTTTLDKNTHFCAFAAPILG